MTEELYSVEEEELELKEYQNVVIYEELAGAEGRSWCLGSSLEGLPGSPSPREKYKMTSACVSPRQRILSRTVGGCLVVSYCIYLQLISSSPTQSEGAQQGTSRMSCRITTVSLRYLRDIPHARTNRSETQNANANFISLTFDIHA